MRHRCIGRSWLFYPRQILSPSITRTKLLHNSYLNYAKKDYLTTAKRQICSNDWPHLLQHLPLLLLTRGRPSWIRVLNKCSGLWLGGYLWIGQWACRKPNSKSTQPPSTCCKQIAGLLWCITIKTGLIVYWMDCERTNKIIRWNPPWSCEGSGNRWWIG